MAGAHLLGIDFGTGGAKATIINDEGENLAYAYREYQLVHPQPGWSEHDPDRYWSVTCELIASVLTESRSDPAQIAGIALSSALPSLVLVDSDLRPLAPALNLLDRRATEEVSWVRERIGEELIERVTANRIEDHPTLVNLIWFRRNRPEVYRQIHKALTIDGFVSARLCGRATVNATSAVFYGVAYDIRLGGFVPSILDSIEIDPGILPDVVSPTEIIGCVTKRAAAETGLAAGTPLAGGQVDCNAGWVAGGAITPGDVHLNLGTCGVLGVVHKNPDFFSSAAAPSMINIPYTTSPKDTFAAVAATTTGGQALRYLRDTISAGEVEQSRRSGANVYDLLTEQAATIPLGSEGLIVLPYLMGERSPIWDTSARGVLIGLSLHHSRGHIIRAFLEGVAYALYDSFAVLQANGIAMKSPMIFNEGGARSALWRSIITDMFGISTARVQGSTGAPLGDAILAGVAVGVFPNFEIARRNASYGSYLEPNPRRHALYLEYFAAFKSIYEHLRPDFPRLQELAVRTQSQLTIEGQL